MRTLHSQGVRSETAAALDDVRQAVAEATVAAAARADSLQQLEVGGCVRDLVSGVEGAAANEAARAALAEVARLQSQVCSLHSALQDNTASALQSLRADVAGASAAGQEALRSASCQAHRVEALTAALQQLARDVAVMVRSATSPAMLERAADTQSHSCAWIAWQLRWRVLPLARAR